MSTKKLIGRIPVSKGEYVAGQTYNRLSQVTLYGSTYQSRVDGNTSAPAILDAEGNAQHTNTDQWLVIADGREAYNAGEKLSCFSLQENEEFLAAETDTDGKILSYTNADGSHYAYKMKSETIDAKQDKEEGKGLIDEGISESMSVVDDGEDRMQIITDKDGKIISYRDSDGTYHEEKMDVKHLLINGEEKKILSENDVVEAVSQSDDIVPVTSLNGVVSHNTENLLVLSEIQKTFNDGKTSFTPPNAGYEMSNRISCSAGDWITRTGTATGMVVVTDKDDKNGQRLFRSNGTTLGLSFEIPIDMSWVRYIRLAVNKQGVEDGSVVVCKGKKAYAGQDKGDFFTMEKLKVNSRNLSNDVRYLKDSKGNYYQLYIDESDMSVKVKKVDLSTITDLPEDFPIFNISGDFSKYFTKWLFMSNGYMAENNSSGVTNLQKLDANAYTFAEFRMEKTKEGNGRYVAMFPSNGYVGEKGEWGPTIYDEYFNVIATNIIKNADAHDMVYFSDDHIGVFCYDETYKSMNITDQNGNTSTKSCQKLAITELKKINGSWNVVAECDLRDYPRLLTDGVNAGYNAVRSHFNTLKLDYDGNYLINLRDMNCFIKIRRQELSDGTIIIGSKTKDYNEAVIGRVGGVFNSGYMDSKRILEEGFSFTDVPNTLEARSTDAIPLWKFYHEHDTTYWGGKKYWWDRISYIHIV